MTDPKPWPVKLSETRRVYHEDNFAKSPELNMVFPTPQQYTKDVYALDLLARLFADGKKAPLYKVIVEEKRLAPSVSASEGANELAGVFRIRIRAFPGKSLTDVENAIKEAFARFERDGFMERDLARIKAKTETDFYGGISSLLGKSFQLAFYNEYKGSPGFITQDLQNYLDVSHDDIMRVYGEYVKDNPYVLTSFLPKGQANLVAENSVEFPVVEEAIVAEKGEEKTGVAQIEVPKIPSKFDRTKEPPKGPDPEIKLPHIWKDKFQNGLRLYGIEQHELPLVQFSLTLKGGLLLDNPDLIGVANLITDEMMQGTKNKTPVELEEAIDDLGARIRMYTTDESIVIQANCLASRFDQLVPIFEEILLEPRWDQKEFERLKRQTIESINRRNAQPSAIASNVFRKLIYGEKNILSNSTLGTPESVQKITIADLKNYYERYFSPSVAYLSVVGDLPREKAVAAFKALEQRWKARKVTFPEFTAQTRPEKAHLYFVDVPKAKQSEIRIGYLALAYTDPDFYPATVMNYKLGGSFNGFLNMILREEKGYTYGARSGFRGSEFPGPFVASAAVKSNTTFESMKIFKEQLTRYRNGVSERDLAFTKNALVKSNARRFETLGALMRLVNNVARYGLPDDYIKQREAVVRDMTAEKLKTLAQKYIVPEHMVYLVVGDAETQLEPLKALGLGEPVLLDKNGKPVAKGEKTTMK
ncbi:MAG: insulinase family protein [Calditrichaeota bacterium]|nr:MAG: insulinase family protein [Calditrichota bacterium]